MVVEIKGLSDLNERKKNKTVRNILISIVIVFILAVAFLTYSGYNYVVDSLEPMDETSEEIVEIEIPTGSTRRDIAAILEENGLVNSALIFEYYVRFFGDSNFQAGTYLMSPSMSMEEMTTYLNEGGTPIMEQAISVVTVPEGIHLEQIAEQIENETNFSGEEFMTLIEDPVFIQSVSEEYPGLLSSAVSEADVTRYTLEGYLFPATYEIFEQTDLESLIRQMISRMDQAMQPHYASIQSSGFNVHDILTLASYIEREGVTDEDRGLISGVFHNRLRAGMPLQTDPSVAYALGVHLEQTSLEDLEIESPYNTYRYPGVGAGPINSPSESAINASVNPTDTTYMYFLADINTGEVYYSETFEQHLEYQSQYVD